MVVLPQRGHIGQDTQEGTATAWFQEETDAGRES
jgi:hypothetical protein